MDWDRLKALARRYGRVWLAALMLSAVILALIAALLRSEGSTPIADPVQVADRALVSVREQGRLNTLDARFVAVVTSEQSRLGLASRKTLILPARVRYGIDLRRLRREHLSWDEATRTLSITLPPLEISGPEIDMEAAREYAEGGMLMALTGGEEEMDEANRVRARDELMRQARDPAPVATAREAALRTVARGFALPLRAAGIEASVAVRFVDPSGADIAVHLDRPPRVEDPVADRQAGARELNAQ